MNLSARHTGDHDGRAGHVDLLNIHAKLGEEPFFLRDPKRANPGADIGVTDDDFRRRDEKLRCEDDAKHKNHCQVKLFHRTHLLRFAEIEKPLPIRLPHLEGSGEDEWRKAWMRGRVVKRLCGTAIGYKDFTQPKSAFVSRANAAAGYRFTGSRSIASLT